jgi:GNAT superfamily N-acetyltransferase
LDPVVRAIEENTVRFLMAMGRAGGGEQRDDGRVRWTIGGSPIDYHNAVVAADLGPDEADEVIRRSIDRFRHHGVSGTWHVGASMAPADLDRRLEAHGLTLDDEEAGMALELGSLPDVPPVPGLEIEPLRDEEGLARFVAVLGRGFGEGPREAEWVGETYQRIGLDDQSWRHYLARSDGEPVGTSTLFLHDRVGGVYFVSTIPSARRRGIGAAVTMAAVRDATDLGCRLAVLGSSTMGYSVYRRLGFEERCRFRIYVWTLAADLARQT